MTLNWMHNYTAEDYLEFLFSVKCINMYVRSWNERLSLLSIYNERIAVSQTGHNQFGFTHETIGYLQRPPEDEWWRIVEGCYVLSEQDQVISYGGKAKLVDTKIKGKSVATYQNLDIKSLIVGMRVQIDDFRSASIISFTDTTFTINDSFPNNAQVDDIVFFYPQGFIDVSKTTNSWLILYRQINQYASYFVKNEGFDEYVNTPNSWAEPTVNDNYDQYHAFFKDAGKDWTKYGPTDKYIPNIFTRKYPNEISIFDQVTINPHGPNTYSAGLDYSVDGKVKLIGSVRLYKDGTWHDDYIPSDGERARLVGTLINSGNPWFQYYVLGHTFTYNKHDDAWYETPKESPNIIIDKGLPKKGDYAGEWCLNELRDAINLLEWTFTSSHNPYLFDAWTSNYPALRWLRQRGFFFNNVKQIILDQTPVKDDLVVYTHSKISKNARIMIGIFRGFYVNQIRSGVLEISSPIDFGGIVTGDYAQISNLAFAELDETTTKFKSTFKIKNLDSDIQVGMMVRFSDNKEATLVSFTPTTITVNKLFQDELTSKNITLVSDSPLLYSNLGVTEEPWTINFADRPFVPLFYKYTTFGRDPITDAPVESISLWHIPDPTVIQGSFPSSSCAISAVHSPTWTNPLISGLNPLSKDLHREIHCYIVRTNMIDDFLGVNGLPDFGFDDKIPTKTPRFEIVNKQQFNFDKAEQIPETVSRYNTIDPPYVNQITNEALGGGGGFTAQLYAIIKWSLKYTKNRTQDEQ